MQRFIVIVMQLCVYVTSKALFMGTLGHTCHGDTVFVGKF